MSKVIKVILTFLFCVAPAFAQNYYLGPWVWRVAIDPEAWVAPAGARMVVDLRSLPQQGQLGPVAEGVALFDSSILLPPPYTLIGQGADASLVTMDTRVRDAWGRATGYTPSGATLTDALWDQTTNGADPSGMTGTKPLMPEFDETARELRLNLHIGNLTRSEQFDIRTHPLRTKVETVLQASYQRVVENVAAQRVPVDLPGMVLDYWTEKYRIPKADRAQWERLVPPDLRESAALIPHRTTITEDWNCSDSDNPDCDLDWTETRTDIDIVSNVASCQGTGRGNLRSPDLSSDDHYSQFVLANTSGEDASINYLGPAVRYDPANNDTHYMYLSENDPTPRGTLIKLVNNTWTELEVNTETISIGQTWKVSADGSTITGYIDSVQQAQKTDAAITGYVKTGLMCDNSADGSNETQADSFEAADLAAASVARRRIINSE